MDGQRVWDTDDGFMSHIGGKDPNDDSGERDHRFM
jgi:hypothetical protein